MPSFLKDIDFFLHKDKVYLWLTVDLNKGQSERACADTLQREIWASRCFDVTNLLTSGLTAGETSKEDNVLMWNWKHSMMLQLVGWESR